MLSNPGEFVISHCTWKTWNDLKSYSSSLKKLFNRSFHKFNNNSNNVYDINNNKLLRWVKLLNLWIMRAGGKMGIFFFSLSVGNNFAKLLSD